MIVVPQKYSGASPTEGALGPPTGPRLADCSLGGFAGSGHPSGARSALSLPPPLPL